MNKNGMRKIREFGASVDGVFTLPDLRVLLNWGTEPTFFRAVRGLVEEGGLVKVKRGLYALPDASLEVISSRIEPQSYISTNTVLARAGIIGSVPVRRVQAVKRGRPRKYKCSLGAIEHLSIRPDLFFGYISKGGYLYAVPEKAFLDACYYSFKGRRMSFDVYSDVNIELLDMARLNEYLQKYDRRFVSFCTRIWRNWS